MGLATLRSLVLQHDLILTGRISGGVVMGVQRRCMVATMMIAV